MVDQSDRSSHLNLNYYCRDTSWRAEAPEGFLHLHILLDIQTDCGFHSPDTTGNKPCQLREKCLLILLRNQSSELETRNLELAIVECSTS
jgi:hypothetical protein